MQLHPHNNLNLTLLIIYFYCVQYVFSLFAPCVPMKQTIKAPQNKLKFCLDWFCFSGSVALIVGGEGKFDVELYSPEGQCQHLLAPIPGRIIMTEFWKPVLAYLGGKIMACHGGDNNNYCWTYQTSNNTWSELRGSKYFHNHFPGNGHIFNNI